MQTNSKQKHNKRLCCVLLLVYLALNNLYAQENRLFSFRKRIWVSNEKDDGSVFPIGNGNLLVYEQGPNIINAFGPPYSSPSYFKMRISDNEKHIKVISRRERNTAIWHHFIFRNDKLIGRMVDYILPDKNVFFRDAEMSESLVLKTESAMNINVYDLGQYFKNVSNSVKLFSIPSGTDFFVNNPTPKEYSMLMTASGNIETQMTVDRSFTTTLKKGKSRVTVTSAEDYPTAFETANEVINNNKDYQAQSRKYWLAFSARRKNFSAMMPASYKLKDSILDAIDGVSVLIKCQQSASGGIMAGHYYNMAYVRDQSGVLRGLLALGYFDEAKALINFWINKFNLFGNILTADGMGNNAARLKLNNDEVETPAYLILDCFNYYDKTHDATILQRTYPMMKWAFNVQLKHIAGGMTEFGGDETYLAGGFFPNNNIYQGSAESTLLFVEGGERFLTWAGQHKLLSKKSLKYYSDIIKSVKGKYRDNFIVNGTLYANNPMREQLVAKPRFRFGQCNVHSKDQKTPAITWTELDSSGRYICPDCRNKNLPPLTIDKQKRYLLNSVLLVPGYINSKMFNIQQINQIISPSIKVFQATGSIPSDLSGIRSVGYDYGLLLYNLVKLNNPLKDAVLRKTLAVLDPTGAWVEYYDNDVPYHCRSRPWESGVNIESVIDYIEAMNKSSHKKRL